MNPDAPSTDALSWAPMPFSEGRIVVPLDGSKAAENALPFADLLADIFDASVEVVHVVDSAARDRTDRELSPQRLEQYGEVLVTEYGLRAARYQFSLLHGRPAERILRVARGAAAIVLASHGRTGFRAIVVGSVADKIVRRATVPVVLVPGRGRPPSHPQRLLVALDGSEDSERALALARRVALALNARITLLRAYLPMTRGFRDDFHAGRSAVALKEGASAYLSLIAQPGETTRVVEGDAATAIIRAAADIDAGLVVMTSTGLGLAGRLFMGSTTDRVFHSLHRPLMIIRPTA